MKTKFELGQVCITSHARDVLNPSDVDTSLRRHASGDWGDVCMEDNAENSFALREGLRLFSVYYDSNQVKFWIITEADRSSTTVLLPEDY